MNQFKLLVLLLPLGFLCSLRGHCNVHIHLLSSYRTQQLGTWEKLTSAKCDTYWLGSCAYQGSNKWSENSECDRSTMQIYDACSGSCLGMQTSDVIILWHCVFFCPSLHMAITLRDPITSGEQGQTGTFWSDSINWSTAFVPTHITVLQCVIPF